MTLLEKINKLNELCGDSLSITKYKHWTCNSYHEGTLLHYSIAKTIEGNTFEEMIDSALEYIENQKKIITVNGKKYRLVEE